MAERTITVQKTVVHSANYAYILGMCIAVVISWTENHSILWAIFHGILSWFYVIYYAFF